MRSYVDINPRGVHGSVSYHIKEDFGADPAALRNDLQFYVD
jgi:hypothetical protein